LAYFNSDRVVSDFHARFADCGRNNPASSFIPVLEAISDELFGKLIDDPIWQKFLGLVRRLQENDIHRFIDILMLRQRSEIVVSFVLRSLDQKFVTGFAHRLGGLGDLSVSDLICVHDAICLLLDGPRKNSRGLCVLLQLAVHWFKAHIPVPREVKERVKFTDKGVLRWLQRDTSALITEYAVALCDFSPETLENLNSAVEELIQSPLGKSVSLPVVMFAFEIIRRADTNDVAIAERFSALVERCDTSDTEISEQIFGLALKWIRGGDPCQRAVLFRDLFSSAQLTSQPEKEFFKIGLRALKHEAIRDIIAMTTRAMTVPPKQRNRQAAALENATRVAFLVSDVWPDRKDEIIKKIDPRVRASIDNKAGPWQKISQILEE
jgi:hypothetical protein